MENFKEPDDITSLEMIVRIVWEDMDLAVCQQSLLGRRQGIRPDVRPAVYWKKEKI